MKHKGILLFESVNDRESRDAKFETYQAKLPIKATNLSNSLDPAQESKEQKITIQALNTFFCHLTEGLCLPDLEKRPFSMIRTAGKS